MPVPGLALKLGVQKTLGTFSGHQNPLTRSHLAKQFEAAISQVVRMLIKCPHHGQTGLGSGPGQN